ncbi:MAG: DUF502 domain-containing protein [Sedimentisphaerales bacterium]|nr:DUF502 domain-containing protein [Sedimentisphaerales bacterium]
MGSAHKEGFWKDFRRFFFRGLATLLPTVLTIVLLFKCFEFIQKNISIHITRGMIYVVVYVTDKYPGISTDDQAEFRKEHDIPDETAAAELRKEMRRWKLENQWAEGPQSLIGFFIAIILVYVLGRLLASYLGRKFWGVFEGTVQRVPGFKQVYPYVKQVTEFLFSERKISFTSKVVAVPYPRQGIWSLGLVTGSGFRKVSETTGQELVTVFIPSSPTPVTGYVIYVKKEEIIDLPITIEEALRFTISGGVIVPDHQVLPGQAIDLQPGPAAAAIPGLAPADGKPAATPTPDAPAGN